MVNRLAIWCSIMAWTFIVNGFGSRDIETLEKVDAYKAELKTQSVEQVGILLDAMLFIHVTKDQDVSQSDELRHAKYLPTWRKRLVIDEVVTRKPNGALNELDRIDKGLSKWGVPNSSMELRAKIAVDKIRLTSRTMPERIDRLGKMLDSTGRENILNAQEAAREMLSIGTPEARDALLAREDKWPIMAKEYRLEIDIKNLSTEVAIDLLLDSARKDLSTPEKTGIAKIVPEDVILSRILFLHPEISHTHLTKRLEEVLAQKETASKANVRYIIFLQDLLLRAERRLKNAGSFARDEEKLETWLKSNQTNNPAKNVDKDKPNASFSSNAVPSKVVSPPPPPRSEHKTFTRPEERGEDYSGKDSRTLISILSQSKDKIEARKAAKVLGDRSIDGTLKLTEEDKSSMTNIVQKCLQQVLSADANERSEAREQIERLWWSATPGLMANLGNENSAVIDVICKELSLMRTDEIICSLIEQAKKLPTGPSRKRAVLVLGFMTEKRESLISGRRCMDEATSRELAEKKIRPLLYQFLESEKDPSFCIYVNNALKYLERATDRRLRQVPQK